MDGFQVTATEDEETAALTIAARVAELVPRFAERAAEYDRSGEIPSANLDELRAAGLTHLALPKAYGGQALGLRQTARIIADIARGDPSTALILAMQYLQSGSAGRSANWPEPVHAELFGSIVQDGALVNALRVEPELGTPARGGLPATIVRRDGDRFVVSGSKIFSTGSHALRWGVVWARTDDEIPRVGQVLVRLDLPGIRIEETWNQLGMRATGSHTIVFEDVEIPERWLVDLRRPKAWAEEGRAAAAEFTLVVVGLYDAIAREARDWLIDFLKTRTPTNLGAPLATLPRFHTLVGEIDALLLSNQALLDHAFNRHEAGQSLGGGIGLVKHLVTENAIEAVGKAVAAIGNPGISRDNPLERHYRNVLCGRIHTPQSDAVLAAAGREAFRPD